MEFPYDSFVDNDAFGDCDTNTNAQKVLTSTGCSYFSLNHKGANHENVSLSESQTHTPTLTVSDSAQEFLVIHRKTS